MASCVLTVTPISGSPVLESVTVPCTVTLCAEAASDIEAMKANNAVAA